MLARIDHFFNSITMYRLVLYTLAALALVAVILGFLGMLPSTGGQLAGSAVFLPLLCFGANKVCAALWRAPVNTESALITGLILFLIMPPATSWRNAPLLVAAGVIAMDDTTCIPRALWYAAKFFAHESCGQCSPCREGTGWIFKIVDRILNGQGRPQDLDVLLGVAGNMEGRTICVFADARVSPVAVRRAGPCVPWNSGLLMKFCSTESRLAPPCNWPTQ